MIPPPALSSPAAGGICPGRLSIGCLPWKKRRGWQYDGLFSLTVVDGKAYKHSSDTIGEARNHWEEKMRGIYSFNDPLRSSSHGHKTDDTDGETQRKRALSQSVEVEEGLIAMISKLIEMTRLLSHCFAGSLDANPDLCLRLVEAMREQGKLVTKALVSMRGGEKLINSLIRFPSSLERVGHMLENILDGYRTKMLAECRFSDKAHREHEQIFALLLDILTNLRDAFQNPNRRICLAVLAQGNRLEEMIRKCIPAHWQRVTSGTWTLDASTMGREILDSAKWANEYLMEVASTLLELGEAQKPSAQPDTAAG